ncbi:hypothetical protein [Nitrospira sp. BLG_2]|uniref:hypothetical protein n=1 Tax=Nitrospira sp. BLG_2 TaxID=3397507 RepID=UPI003B9DBF8E
MPVRAAAAGFLCCAGLLAQGTPTIFQKATPEVESALRARITEFYQAHVDGKFRQAEQVVHEGSREVFYSAEKTKFESFKIVSINYEEDYTKAKVLVEVPWELVMPGFGRVNKVPRPVGSLWKLDKGQWWWYVEPYDPCKGIMTPWGVMHKQECKDGKPLGPVTGAPGGIPLGDLMKSGPSIKEIQTSLKASADSMTLSSDKASDGQVLLTNHFQGPVTLQYSIDQMPGIELVVDKDKLEPGESATLTVKHKPTSPTHKPDIFCRVRVQPTAQLLELRVAFALPSGGTEGVSGPAKPKK